MNTNLLPPPEFYPAGQKALGPTLHKAGLSCRHFADLSLQAMDRKLTWAEKFRYRFHSLLCVICRNFEKQIHSISAVIRASFVAKELAKPDPAFLATVHIKLSEMARTQIIARFSRRKATSVPPPLTDPPQS